MDTEKVNLQEDRRLKQLCSMVVKEKVETEEMMWGGGRGGDNENEWIS